MAHGETEALHGRSDGKSASDTMHTYSVSAFQIGSESGSSLVLQKVAHPRLWSSLVLELLSDLALQDSKKPTLGPISAKLPSLRWYDGFGKFLEKPKFISECPIRRHTYE
jgi:hypothetical protein